MHRIYILLVVTSTVLCSAVVSAQTSIQGVINIYTPVTGFNNCDNAFTVGSSAGFSVGDRVLIIQMKGATVNQTEGPNFGQITSLGSAGKFEYNTISSITGNVIGLSQSVVNTYNFSGKVQMVRVPQYTDAILNFGNTLTCLPWNGTTGGVLALECTGTFTLEGSINVTGMGFRGGTVSSTNNNNCPASPNLVMGMGLNDGLGAEKGEGITDFVPGIQAGRGPWANGGGGGNKLNAGGGGGGNAAVGGVGGRQTNLCAGVVDNGGLGGYALANSSADPRVFLGGGGGSGDRNDGGGSPGGNGGGIVLIKCGVSFGSNTFGIIDASGQDAPSIFSMAGDGNGGGGGGGSVVIDAPALFGSYFVLTYGGKGGNTANASPNCYAPGGGGGGGFIATCIPAEQSAAYVQVGGTAGVIESGGGPLCFNDTYGATNGGDAVLVGNFCIPEGTPGTIPTGNVTQTLCFGGTLNVNGTVFSAANPVGSVLIPNGSVFGCDSIVNVNLSFYPQALGSYSATLCPGQTVTIGNTTFSLTNPNGTVVLPGAGQGGCDSTVQVALTFLTPGTSTFNQLLCPGQTVTIGNSTFSQINPTGTAVIPGGSANGCDSIVTVNLTYHPQIVANLSVTGAVCPGEQALLTITLTNAAGFGIGSVSVSGGGSTYEFNNINSGFSFQVTPPVTSVFSITNIDVPGYACTPSIGSSPTVVVTQLNPTVTVLSNYNGFDVSCENAANGIASVAVTGTPPYQYAWSSGATTSTASNLPPGVGGVTVTDANNCTESVEFILDAPPAISFELSNTEPSCFGETDATITVDTVFGGFAPYYVSFDGQLAFPLPPDGFTYTNLGAGQYNVTVLDKNNCGVSQQVYIPAPEELLVNIGVDTIIDLGDSLTLVLQSNFDPGQITWSTLSGPFATDTTFVTVGPLYETTYIVDVVDTVTGCVATHRITVKISKERLVFVPTIFSPNGDSNNDVFYIFADPKIIQNIPVMRIYDRWGTKVFERTNFPPNDPLYGFDGFHRGNLMIPQVLTYYFEVVYIDGRRQFFEGDVTILR